MELRTGLSYGDVLLVPQRSPVESRDDVTLSTTLAPGLDLDVPVLSAAMDTVTEAELAIALSRAGGLGVLHRFCTIAEQVAEVEQVVDAGERVAIAVGIDEDFEARAAACVEAGACALVVDVAHGHLETCLDATRRLADEFPDVPLVVGNVVTAQGVEDLAAAGADCVKVGVGPGSHCTTRERTGAGMPQLTAVDDCAAAAERCGVTTIADGGIRSSGDAVKALMAGADAVMMGGYFAGTDEAPGRTVTLDGERYKVSRGMASEAANHERTDKDLTLEHGEGVEALTPAVGPFDEHLAEFLSGMRSGLSYCGGRDIAEARAKAEFVQVAESARDREGIHSVAAMVDGDIEGAAADD
ncbi:guanosine monophosphate reductase [Haloarchaeobius amylolyticus]|uniref:guanosine monophosphate reductase n=1 Tax=Haloarchaeobius amylolyticus TaxID=1198296 RepID=UPI00226DD07D|nr:IMP dehydrogenase [Haloarchaeobius amylolyticus]